MHNLVKGVVCIAGNTFGSFAFQGRFSATNASAVSVTATLNDTILVSVTMPDGLYMTHSDDAAKTFADLRQILPHSSCACVGSITALPNNKILLIHGSPTEHLAASVSSDLGFSFTRAPATLWNSGSGCSSAATITSAVAAVFFEQHPHDTTCVDEQCAAERLMLTHVPLDRPINPPPAPPPPPPPPPPPHLLPQPVLFDIPVKDPTHLSRMLHVVDRTELPNQTDAYKPWITRNPLTGELLMSYAARRKTLLVIRRSSSDGASWGPEELQPDVGGDKEVSITALSDGIIV